MPILQQPVPLSYSHSPYLALPAPRIAGLLPATVGPNPRVGSTPPPKPFVYADVSFAALPDKVRTQLDSLARVLLEATVGLLADERTEAEFTLAAGTFVRQVTALYHNTVIGDPKPVIESPFARARQRLDEKLEQMQAESRAHLAEARERIAREIATRHAAEGRP